MISYQLTFPRSKVTSRFPAIGPCVEDGSLGPFLSPPTLRGVLWDNMLTHLWFPVRILLEETPIFYLPFLISDASNAV
jgi:hypothetical protein